MAEEIDVLRSVPLFSGLSDRELRKVRGISKEVTHEAGHVIVESDHSAIGFHLITNGTVDAAVGGEVVGKMGPGDYFGEMSLLDGKPRSATVTAATELKTIVIPSWSFNQMLDRHPEMMRALLVELCARIRQVEAPRS